MAMVSVAEYCLRFKAFLNGRSQTVVSEGDCSKEVPVTSGVSQGLVLGPINPLPGLHK